MKNLLFVCFFLLFEAQSAKAQIAHSTLDVNQASAILSDGGILFYGSNGQSTLTVPKDSVQSLLYSATNWFGGIDANGQLKLAASALGVGSTDLWPGPLTADGSATAGNINPLGASFFTVTKAEIYQHLLHYQDVGYQVPASIANWPAHGDVSLLYDYYLAPFVDTDDDQTYYPLAGDYPCIKGDKATYMIMNDKKLVHGSGADPIGLEIHYLVYQYDSTGDLGNTTFFDIKYINRGTQTIFNTRASFAMDGDLGSATDDYFGCDSSRNLQYYFNDAVDEGLGGFGVNPPSFGIVCLSDDISSAVTLNGSNHIPAQIYNTMMGKRGNGQDVLDAQNGSTTFEFYDNPNQAGGWNGTATISVDKKTVMSVDLGTFAPNQVKTISYALVYNRSGNTNLENVDELMLTTDNIQAFFDASTDGDCSQSILGTIGLEEGDIRVKLYPNPSNGEFVINLPDFNRYTVLIQDVTGRIVYNEESLNGLTKVQLDAPAGMYMVNILTKKGYVTRRMIAE